MPWRNGLYVRLQSWAARAAAGATISATEFDADGNDEASALNNCILRDGTGSPTADIPFAGHSLTGIRQAAAAGEPMEFAQAKALIAAAGGSVSNRLQNASFLVNQRGVSGTINVVAGAYGHDRWKGGASGAIYAVSTVGADGQAALSSGSLSQIVAAPDVDSATMTLGNQGTAQGRVYPLGGSPPAFAACPVTATNLTPGQAVVVEFSGGTVLQPQLEPGPTAHAFSRRPLVVDYLLCQAFYEVTPFQILTTLGNGNTDYQVPFNFRVPKAVAPAITLSTSVNTGGGTLSAKNISALGFSVDINGGSVVIVIGIAVSSCEP